MASDVAVGRAQDELRFAVVDGVVVDVEAIDLSGDGRGIGDGASPTIEDLADGDFVSALKLCASPRSVMVVFPAPFGPATTSSRGRSPMIKA